jgi:hypothetical protein
VIVGPVRLTAQSSTALATFEIYEEDGKRVCGLQQLEGRFDLPPKQWLRMVRAEMTKLEGIARDAGCAEMRIAGRDWSRVLPDYEPLPGGKPNRLRKRLI